MKVELNKITPRDVFVTTLTPEEFKKTSRSTQAYRKNKPTGNEFMDILADAVGSNLMCTNAFYGQHLGVSAVTLNKVTGLYADMTFKQWRNAYITLAAYELLKETNDTLSQIAVRLGFPSSNSFSRWFVQTTKTAPGLWKNAARKDKRRQEAALLKELREMIYKGTLHKENGTWMLDTPQNQTAPDKDE